MRIVSYDGIEFADHNIKAWFDRALPGPNTSPIWLDQVNSDPQLAGLTRGGRVVPAQFVNLIPSSVGANDEARLVRLLGLLNPSSSKARTLVVEVDVDTDKDGVADEVAVVQAQAVIGQWSWASGDAKRLTIPFITVSAVWRESEGSTTSLTSHGYTVDRGLIPDIEGSAEIVPVLRLQPTALRSSTHANYGWKYRQVVTVQNPTSRSWYRQLIPLEFANTDALVSGGKALASGNDFRVLDSENGEELARTLAAWNTKKTLVWILVTIPAGGSRDYHAIYGNASSGIPPTLTPINQYSNPSFDTDLTGWADGGGTGSATFTWTRDTGVFNSTPASLRFNVTAGATVNMYRRYSPDDLWPVEAGRTYEASCWVRTGNTERVPKLVFHWYDQDQVNIGQATIMADYVPTTGVFFKLVMEAVAPAGARYMKVGAEVKITLAGSTGSTYFDDFSYEAQSDPKRDYPAPDLTSDSGTATGGAATTLTDTGKTWVTNQWVGATAYVTGGTGSGSSGPVSSNTPTVLTVSGWTGTAPAASSTYVIFRSTATKWVYRVDHGISLNDGEGMWWIDRGAEQPQDVSFDGPGRWRPMIYGSAFQEDAYEVDRFHSGGGIWIARARIRRGPPGKSDNYANNKFADGVMLYVPFGISQIRMDYHSRNSARPDGAGVDEFRILARDAAAEQWTTLLTDNALRDPAANVAAANYTCPAGTVLVGFALVGNGDLPVPSSVPHTVDGFARPNSVLEVSLNPTGFSVGTPGAEEQIHDMYAGFRLGGSNGGTAYPRQELHIGGYGTSRKIAVPLNNWLVIDAAKQTAEEWDSDLSTLIRSCTFAVKVVDQTERGDTITTRTAEHWLKMRPYDNPLTNPSFATDLTNWANEENGTNLTVVWTRDPSVFSDAAGGLKGQVTANTAVANTVTDFVNQTEIPISEGEFIHALYKVRTDNVDLRSRVTFDFYDSSDVYISTTREATWTPAAINTWYQRGYSSSAPANAAYVKVGVEVNNISAGGTLGSVWFDDVRGYKGTDYPVLWFVQLDSGIELVLEYQDGYYV
jgi:hypothetical protein